jgi:hypothetical protein
LASVFDLRFLLFVLPLLIGDEWMRLTSFELEGRLRLMMGEEKLLANIRCAKGFRVILMRLAAFVLDDSGAVDASGRHFSGTFSINACSQTDDDGVVVGKGTSFKDPSLLTGVRGEKKLIKVAETACRSAAGFCGITFSFSSTLVSNCGRIDDSST